MKSILLVFLLALTAFNAKAQYIALNQASILKNDQYKTIHSTVSLKSYDGHRRSGVGGMEVGLEMMGIGCVVVLAGYESDKNNLNTFEIIGAVGVSAGYYVFMISGIVYLVGRVSGHERQHYSIIGNKNQVGIAYNF